MAVSVSPGRPVGAALREARSHKGVDLEFVARETCIHARYLEALETDAPLRVFPAPVYARAFLREYARYLGLDPEPMVDTYRADERPASPPLKLIPGSAGERGPRRRVWTIVLVCVLIVSAAAAIIVARTEDDAGRSLSPALGQEAGPGAPVGLGLALDLRIRGERCWVRLVVDGDEVIRQTLRPGYSRRFEGDRRIRMVLGNPDAAVVTLNGERLETPGDARGVYAATVTEDLGEVRIETRASRTQG